jgi:hypothetical protein
MPSIEASFTALKSLPLIQKPVIIQKQKTSSTKRVKVQVSTTSTKREITSTKKKQSSVPAKPLQCNQLRKQQTKIERKFIIA